MNTDDLAKAVAYWLEIESLCGRAHLLSEAALRQPIGHFLIATQNHALTVEERYPETMQLGKGRPTSADFCLRRAGGAKAWTDLFETKWINDRRSFKQEIFDDILRLEAVRSDEKGQPFNRYLVLAGIRTHVRKRVFRLEANIGGERQNVFSGILPRPAECPGTSQSVTVHEAAPEVRDLWVTAAEALKMDGVPNTLRIALVSRHRTKQFGCWIWKINSSSKRALRPLDPDA